MDVIYKKYKRWRFKSFSKDTKEKFSLKRELLLSARNNCINLFNKRSLLFFVVVVCWTCPEIE
jgi:hypothetical protein